MLMTTRWSTPWTRRKVAAVWRASCSRAGLTPAPSRNAVQCSEWSRGATDRPVIVVKTMLLLAQTVPAWMRAARRRCRCLRSAAISGGGRVRREPLVLSSARTSPPPVRCGHLAARSSHLSGSAHPCLQSRRSSWRRTDRCPASRSTSSQDSPSTSPRRRPREMASMNAAPFGSSSAAASSARALAEARDRSGIGLRAARHVVGALPLSARRSCDCSPLYLGAARLAGL